MLSSYHKIADGMTKLLIDKKSISGVIIFCSDGKHLQLPCWRSFVFYTSVQARVSRSVERMHIYTQNYSSWLASPTTQVSCRKLKTEIIILNLSALEWNRSAYLSTIEWVMMISVWVLIWLNHRVRLEGYPNHSSITSQLYICTGLPLGSLCFFIHLTTLSYSMYPLLVFLLSLFIKALKFSLIQKRLSQYDVETSI